MSSDGRDDRVGYDKDGNSFLVGSDGKPVRDDRGNLLPGPAEVLKDASGWRTYDTSRGHCGLCGRLTCNGGCFK